MCVIVVIACALSGVRNIFMNDGCEAYGGTREKNQMTKSKIANFFP